MAHDDGMKAPPSGSAVQSPTRKVILLSIAASVVTMALKIGAYLFTGSVSLLSDAMESSVNLVAALIAFIALSVADRPADKSHSYGHDKAEYFSSGVEGALILVAAALIIYAAVQRFRHPAPLLDLGAGLTIALVASGINFGVSRFMLRMAKRHDSISLEADAQHLMTDVWTSLGVIAALGVVAFAPPEWIILDPIIAILVGLNIIHTGASLIRRSMAGSWTAACPRRKSSRSGMRFASRWSRGPAFTAFEPGSQDRGVSWSFM